MNRELLPSYEHLLERLIELRGRRTALHGQLEKLNDELATVELDYENARRALELAIIEKHSGATSPGTVAQPPDQVLLSEPPSRPPQVRQSYWDLMVLIPKDGDIGMEEVRNSFMGPDGVVRLSRKAINTRLSKAKRAGLIETAGWGRYKLTEKGKRLMWPPLAVVPGSGEAS